MRKIYILLICMLISFAGNSQTEISAFGATGSGYSTASLTDYQCLGVNPANLGWRRNQQNINLGFFEFGGSIFAEPLSKKEAISDLLDNSKNLTYQERIKAAEQFNGTRLWAQLGITWVGFSYQDDKLGGFGFSMRERFNWNTVFNINASNFTFLGFHDPYFDSLVVEGGDTIGYSTNPGKASDVYEGSQLRFIWYREYNIGYGRQVLDIGDIKLFAGLNLKFITGYGSFQYYQEGDKLHAYSALCPVFDVDYDTYTPSAVEGKGMKKVGSGFGFDLGVTAELFEKIRVAVAINDIGTINWNGNVYQGNETKVWKIETGGIDNYNIFQQGELIQTDNAPDDNGEWEGLESKRVGLPTNFRAGATYKLNKMFEAGADFYLPVGPLNPGSYESGIIGLGFKFAPVNWVKFSLGMVSGGKLGTSIPFGISFFPANNEKTSWELGIGLRDASTIILKMDHPMVGVSFGFLRFSIGNK